MAPGSPFMPVVPLLPEKAGSHCQAWEVFHLHSKFRTLQTPASLAPGIKRADLPCLREKTQTGKKLVVKLWNWAQLMGQQEGHTAGLSGPWSGRARS